MITIGRLTATLSVVAVLLSLVPQARAIVIPAGDDLFVTDPGSLTANDTWLDSPFPLPAGFFGNKSGTFSDPVPAGTRLFLQGVPAALPDPPGPFPAFEIPAPFDEVAALAQHGLKDARNFGGLSAVDTIVQRLAPANLPLIGSQDTIPIEIIALELKSLQPITVTFTTGGPAQPPSFFDVFIDLQPTQNLGSMTLTRTSSNGGTFDLQLPVLPRFVFQNNNPSDPPTVQQTLGPFNGPSDTFISDDTPWLFNSAVPEPSTLALAALGLVGVRVVAWRRRRRA